MEKALNLRVEDANGNRVPTAGRTLHQKTRRVCEDFGEGSPDTRDIEPFTASEGGSHRHRRRSGLRKRKITGGGRWHVHAAFMQNAARMVLFTLSYCCRSPPVPDL